MFICRKKLVLLFVTVGLAVSVAQVPEFDRHLLLDSRIISSTSNASLKIGTVEKHPDNPLFGEDKPWEPRLDNVYGAVIFDEKDSIWKCWYNPFVVDEMTTRTPEDKRNPYDTEYKDWDYERKIGVCYAYSSDGLNWIKPNLGLVEFNGNKNNNLIMWVPGPHGLGVFLDEQDPDTSRRFKSFHSTFDFEGDEMVSVSWSSDGIHWVDNIRCPEINSPGDTHNNAVWDPVAKIYRGYTRLKVDGRRVIGYTESPDYVDWTEARVIFQGYDPHIQLHDMIVSRTAGIFIGLVGAEYFNKVGDPYIAVTQRTELAWSPNGTDWNFIEQGEALIPNGDNGHDTYYEAPYDWGCVFANTPLYFKDEIRIYYGASNWYFYNWRKGYLALATLRPDGWAGYEPNTAGPGTVTTVPVKSLGSELCISADIADGGNVSVTLMDENDTVLAESDAVTDTVTDAVLTWKDGFSLSSVDRESIKLKFEFQNAEIYSFSFGDTAQVNVTAGNTEVPVPGHTLDLVRSSGRMLGINYSLRVPGDVRIRLFDMRGRCQAVLNEGRRQPGSYMASLNTSGFAAGAYTVHLKAGSLNFWKKVLICK